MVVFLKQTTVPFEHIVFNSFVGSRSTPVVRVMYNERGSTRLGSLAVQRLLRSWADVWGSVRRVFGVVSRDSKLILSVKSWSKSDDSMQGVGLRGSVDSLTPDVPEISDENRSSWLFKVMGRDKFFIERALRRWISFNKRLWHILRLIGATTVCYAFKQFRVISDCRQACSQVSSSVLGHSRVLAWLVLS